MTMRTMLAGDLVPGHRVLRFGHLRTVVKVGTRVVNDKHGKTHFTRDITLDKGEVWQCYDFRRVTVTDYDPLTPAPPA